MVPTAKSIAWLYTRTGIPSSDASYSQLQSAAAAFGVELLLLSATSVGDFEGIFRTLVDRHIGAVSVGSDAVLNNNRERLIALAAQHGIPAIYHIRECVTAGGLASYGTRYSEAFRQVGDYVGRVLNGEWPENLPVQQITKIELVINMGAAKALGLSIPPTLFATADEVIE